MYSVKHKKAVLEFEKTSGYEEKLGKATGILMGIGMVSTGKINTDLVNAANDLQDVFEKISSFLYQIKTIDDQSTVNLN